MKLKEADSKNSIFSKISYIFVMGLTGILALIIAVLAIKLTVYFKVKINFAGESCYFRSESILLNLFLVFAAFLIFYILYKIADRINKKILFVIMLIITTVLGFTWVYMIQLKPSADQMMVKKCAEAILDNKLEEILGPGEYLNRNPHQLGFVLYILAIFKVFNTRSDLLLQTFNVIYSILNSVILYFICKKIFKEEKVQKISLIFITFFSLYWTFFNTHIYGNIPGLTFALLAVLFTIRYLDTKKFYNLAIIGALLTVAYLLKSNYEIFLCAIAIIILLNIINTRKPIDLLGIALIIVMIFGTKTVLYKIAEKALGYSLDTGVPMSAYIYMGMSQPDTLAAGWYNSEVEEIYKESGFDSKKAAEITNELLENRIEESKNDPAYTVNYFYSKFQTTWLNPTFQTVWCSLPSTLMNEDKDYGARISANPLIGNVLCGDIYTKLENAMDIFEDIIFIFAGVRNNLLN